MAENKDFYSILGLTDADKQLSEKEFNDKLRTVYRKLASQWHPDRFSTKSENEKKEAEEKFKEISEAYNTLSDPQKRQQYDFQHGGADSDPFGGFNPWDIFTGGRSRPRQYKGKDVQITISISLEDAYTGGKRDFSFHKETVCGHCNGSGSADGKVHTCTHCNGTGMISEVKQQGNMRMINNHPCPHCNGQGKVITKPCSHCGGHGMTSTVFTETVDIPRGVKNGMYINLNGKGCELPKGVNGVNGDLIVVFRVKEHDIYEVEDNDIFMNLHVDVIDALLGCEKTIKCIDGSEVKIKIPECTRHGHSFIIKGKGMPYMGRPTEYGNCCAILHLDMPNKLSNKQKEILKKFKEKK